MRRFNLFLSIILVLFSQVLLAQRPGGGQRPELAPNTGALAGTIQDAMTEEAIAFANILVYKAGTEEMIGGNTSNENGRFFIKDLAYGSYDLKISFIGFEEKAITDITINEESRVGRIDKISLEPAAQNIDAVEVTAQKNEITFGLDKKVFNVEKQINSTGGTAEDVLKNIPSISFDTDGSLSLRGTTNVRVFINGKPSALTGGDQQAVLEQIPASSIKDVEVMTNPNAKFDPDGTGGIINIITKKQNKQGFNTRVALNIGTRDKYDGSISLNYRIKKFNIFGSYNGRHGNYFRERTSNRKTIITDTIFSRNDYEYGEQIRNSHTIVGGLEYFLSTKASVTATATYKPGVRTYASSGPAQFFDFENNLTDTSITTETSDEEESDYEFDLSYNKRFEKEGQELSISGRYSLSPEIEMETEEELFYNAAGINYNRFAQRTVSDDKNTNFRGQLDYTYPFDNEIKLETGLQTSIQRRDNDYIFEGLDEISQTYDLSNQFMYEEDIYSLYGILSGKKNKLSWSAGLRAEQALITSTLVDREDGVFENPYFRLYPSGSSSYKISEKATLQASYSRRVNRPRSRSLNPFVQVRDSLNFSQGNPELLPEFINSFELNYITYADKGTFTIGGYFRQINDIISRFQKVNDANGAITSTWTNLTSGKNYGIEIVGTYRPAKWVRLSANTNIFRSVIDGNNIEADLTNAGYLATGNISANFTMWKDLEFQLASFARSKGVSVQGNYAPIFSIDMTLKKTILKGKGAITLRVSDPLDTRDFEIEINQPNLEQYLKFKRESRIAFLGFSYSLRQEKRNRGDRSRGEGDDGGGFEY